MSRIEYRPGPPKGAPRFLTVLCRVLFILALILALVIAAGTVYALTFRPKTSGASQPSPDSAPSVSSEAAIFTGLGRLRCPTAGPNTALVILQPSFPYFPGDRPFSEELVSRLRDLRSLTAAYFAALSPEDIRRKGETLIKEELLAKYNALLRLGRIETLYFNEYMLIE
jgi:flagellar basal body-associated protein FliL